MRRSFLQTTAYSRGNPNTSVRFNGLDKYAVALDGNANLIYNNFSGTFGYSVWVWRHTSSSGDSAARSFFGTRGSSGNGYRIAIDTDEKFQVTYNVGGTKYFRKASTDLVPLGEWVHLCFTSIFFGYGEFLSTGKVYRNGIELASTTNGDPGSSGGSDFALGCSGNGSPVSEFANAYCKHAIAESGSWNTTQVNDLYNGGDHINYDSVGSNYQHWWACDRSIDTARPGLFDGDANKIYDRGDYPTKVDLTFAGSLSTSDFIENGKEVLS